MPVMGGCTAPDTCPSTDYYDRYRRYPNLCTEGVGVVPQIDIRRGALVITLIEEYGFEADLAAKAALVAHPLDEQPGAQASL